MNRLSKSMISLLLAIVLLLGTAGLSFELLFGLQAHATQSNAKTASESVDEEGKTQSEGQTGSSSSALSVELGKATLTDLNADGTDLLKKYVGGTQTFNNLNFFISHENTSGVDAGGLGNTPVTITFKDENFKPSDPQKEARGTILQPSISGSKLTYTINVKGPVSFTRKSDTVSFDIRVGSSISGFDKPIEVSAKLKSEPGDTGNTASNALQSYGFFRADGEPITKVNRGTYDNLQFQIHDPNCSETQFNKYIEKFSWKINSDVFQVRGKQKPSESNNGQSTLVRGEVSQVKSDGANGVTYLFTLYNVYYTGISNRLKLYLDYDGDGQTNRIINEVLDQFELYEEPPQEPPREPPISDNNNGGSNNNSSRPEIAPPTPNIIVSEYKLSEGSNVTAARNFSIDLTLKNTSKRLPIDNIVMKVAVPEAFTMTSSSNTFYIDMLSKNSTVKRTINLSVKPNAEPISHPIKLSFSFEAVIGETRKQFTSDEEISIPVSQLDRFAVNPIEIPPEIMVGEDTSFEVSFINKGKTPVYNITAEIAGNLSQPGQRQFLGNLESGKEESADFVLGAAEAGQIQGEVIITYEDANMNVSELRSPFQTNAIAFEPPPMPDVETIGQEDIPPPELPWYLEVYQMLPPWGWMVIGVVSIIVISFILKLVRHYREKKLLMEDDDEDF